MSDKLLFTNDYHRHSDLPLSLEGMGICHPQEAVVRSNGIPVYQWVQTVHGCGKLILDGKALLIPEGHGVYLPADVPHEYYDLDSGWRTNFLCFNGSLARELLQAAGFEHADVYGLSDPKRILAQEEQIYDISQNANIYKPFAISKVLYNIILDLSIMATHKQVPSANTYDQKSLRAARFMENHYMEPLTLTDIASSVNLSREYFCSSFKSAMKSSPFDYLQIIRVAHAKTFLLQYPEKKIKEIAAMAGFADSSYFGAVFKKSEGITPNEFRNERR